MRRLFFTILLGAGFLSGMLNAQDCCCPDSVEVVSQFEDLYRYGKIYIGGQPDKEMIEWFQAKGVRQVVNLRTAKENEIYASENFDVVAYVLSSGMAYTSVPVGGGKADAHTDKLGAVAEVLNSGEKVLLHCKTGGRARYFLMEYLIQKKDCPKRIAKKVIREMGYVFPLKLLLGNQIKVTDEDS